MVIQKGAMMANVKIGVFWLLIIAILAGCSEAPFRHHDPTPMPPIKGQIPWPPGPGGPGGGFPFTIKYGPGNAGDCHFRNFLLHVYLDGSYKQELELMSTDSHDEWSHLFQIRLADNAYVKSLTGGYKKNVPRGWFFWDIPRTPPDKQLSDLMLLHGPVIFELHARC